MLSWLLEFEARLYTIFLVTQDFSAAYRTRYPFSELATVYVESFHWILQTHELSELSFEASVSPDDLQSHYVPRWSMIMQMIYTEVRRRHPEAPPWQDMSESYFWALALRPTNLHQRARNTLYQALVNLDESSDLQAVQRSWQHGGRYVGVRMEIDPRRLRGLVALIGQHFMPSISTTREVLSLLEYQQELARERTLVDIRGDLESKRDADIYANLEDEKTRT
eukprot:g64140.t1